MKLAIFVVLFVILFVNGASSDVSVPCSDYPTSPVKGFNLDQPLDHFNKSNPHRWTQCYQLLDIYYETGGPILLLAGFERGLYPYEILISQLFNYARELNGAVLAIEHRYYGLSLPFGTASFSVPNMQWLTIDNAIADFAAVLQDFKATNPQYTNSPVIAFGGSYSALLSSLLRINYPNQFLGAVSSAAPIFLYTSNIPLDYYFNVVSNGIVNAVPECANLIHKGMNQLYKLFEAYDYKTIQSSLSLCNPPTNQFSLPSILKNGFARLAQFNYPNPALFQIPFPLYHLCNISNENSNNWAMPLYMALNFTYNYTVNGHPTSPTCFSASMINNNDNNYFIANYMNNHHNNNDNNNTNMMNLHSSQTDNYAWMYEVCHEVVQPQGGTGEIFVFPTVWSRQDIFKYYCQVNYPGIIQEPYKAPLGLWNNPNFTNIPNNLLFINGLLDPIRAFGPTMNMTKLPNSPITVIDIIDGSHCTDINADQALDPPQLIEARKEIVNIVKQWISNKSNNDNDKLEFV